MVFPRLKTAAVLLAIIATMSCDALTQQSIVDQAAMNQSVITLRFVELSGPGIASGLTLGASLPEGDRLAANEYLPVVVSSSRGGQHIARLRWFCPIESGSYVRCDMMSVTLHPDRTVEELDLLLNQLDAKFVWNRGLTILGGPSGLIKIFTGNVEDAIEQVRQFNAVKFADFEPLIITASENPTLPSPMTIISTDPDLGPRDRTLVAVSGDRLTATYANPDGSIVTAEITLQ